MQSFLFKVIQITMILSDFQKLNFGFLLFSIHQFLSDMAFYILKIFQSLSINVNCLSISSCRSISLCYSLYVDGMTILVYVYTSIMISYPSYETPCIFWLFVLFLYQRLMDITNLV